MSSPPENSSTLAGQIRDLCLGGQLHEALQKATGRLNRQPRDWTIMAEAIRTLICLGQAGPAAGLYQAFTADPGAGNNLEPAALVRLALLLGRRDLLEGMQPPEGPAWLRSLLLTGNDPVRLMTVDTVQTRIKGGHSHFNFLGACPHCAHGLQQVLQDNLLVLHVWICPACFGQVRLDRTVTRDALEESYRGRLDEDLQDWDNRLIEQIRPRITGEVAEPYIVRALAQEYHFLLNEMALHISLAGESGEPRDP